MGMSRVGDRLLVIVATAGFIVEVVISMLAAYAQPALLLNPVVDGVVIVGACLVAGDLIGWARRPGAADRAALVVAILGTAGIIAVLSVFAYALGWWRAPYFQHTYLIRAVADGVGDAAGAALFLLGYRWLKARRPRLALLLYILLILSFLPAVILGDRFSIGAGVFEFGGGYSLAHDVLAGQVYGWTPLIIYELLWRRTSGRSAPILPAEKPARTVL